MSLLRRAATGQHPIDAARCFTQALDPDDGAGLLLALRDLAIAHRRAAGQGRREAQAAVDAVLAQVDGPPPLQWLEWLAEDLAIRWTPQPWPPLRMLGVQALFGTVVAA